MGKKFDDATHTEKYQKLLYILHKLPDKQKLSLTQLAEKLNCSKQTVLTLLNELRNDTYGTLTLHKDGKKHLYSFARASRPPKHALKKKGLDALKLGRDFVADLLPQSFTEATDVALVNAQAYMSDNEHADFARVGETFRKGRIGYSGHTEQLQVIWDCIDHGKVCQISYRKAQGGEARLHDIAPLRIVSYNDALYVRAWVVTDKGEVRPTHDKPTVFAVQRIQEAYATCRSADNLPDEPWSKGFGFVDAESMPVKISFSPAVATYVSERQWSADQTIEEREDGGLTLSMTSTSKRELVSWVLGFGKEATLLEPAPLRQEMAEEMRQMLGRYGE